MIEGVQEGVTQLGLIGQESNPVADAILQKAASCCLISSRRGQVSFQEVTQISHAFDVSRADGDLMPLQERAAYLAVLPAFEWKMGRGVVRIDNKSLQYPTMYGLADAVLPDKLDLDLWSHFEDDRKASYPEQSENHLSPLQKRSLSLRSLLDSSALKLSEYLERRIGLEGEDLAEFLKTHPHLSHFIGWFSDQYPDVDNKQAAQLVSRQIVPFDLYYAPFEPRPRPVITETVVKETDGDAAPIPPDVSSEIQRALAGVEFEYEELKRQKITPEEDLAFETKFAVVNDRVKNIGYGGRASAATFLIDQSERYQSIKVQDLTEDYIKGLLREADSTLYSKLEAALAGEIVDPSVTLKIQTLRSHPHWSTRETQEVILRLIPK